VAVASPHRPSARSFALRAIWQVLGFAFLAVSSYLALMAAVAPPERRTPPLEVEALSKLSPGELAEIDAAARAAFARNPLDAGSISQLSRIAEARGDSEAATRLKLIAGEMQPRAIRIQAEALQILLERRDFQGVMTKLDGLIRARPNRAGDLFAVAAEVAADPVGRNAVAAELTRRPPWRQQFLARTISAGKPELVQEVFSELRALGSPASASELALLVAHYLRSGEIEAAYTTWLSSLDAQELKQVKLVYDGGFDQEVKNLSFDWTIEPAKGLSYRLFPRNTASMDMTLQLDFKDVRGAFASLSQITRLRPGRYRLRGEARFEGFQSPSGVVFRIHCLSGVNLRRLDETGPIPQSGQWIAFEKIFSVPAADCPDQILRLESRRGADAEGVTKGLLALDNIAIDTLPALAP
jgi:hypothetical protein